MAPSKKLYEVEKILDVRGVGAAKEYYIKWKGYKSSENTWESAANTDCPELIREFENNQKSRPKAAAKKTPKKATPILRESVAPPPASRRKSVPPPQARRRKSRTQSESRHALPTESEVPAKKPKMEEEEDAQRSHFDVLSETSTPYEFRTRRHSRTIDRLPTAKTTFTPYSEVQELNFTVKSIKGMKGKTGDEVVVYDNKGQQRVVKAKAVAKQDPDILIDYFLSRRRAQ